MDKTTKGQVFVIGHRNPDTDSICSAISYANLKSKISQETIYIPKRAGQINGETQFILNHFDVEVPEYVSDVGTQVKDVEIYKTEGVQSDISLKKAWTLMKDNAVATIPVINEDELEGIIAVKDIATANMDIYENKILAMAQTEYKNILETLDATMIVGDENACVTKGKLLIAAANPDLMENYIEEGDMVILGNRYESQLCAIEMNAGCIVVCMGAPVSKTIKKLAQQRGCAIISTPHDTYIVARLINQSTPIRYFMKRDNLITFKMDDFINEIKGIMAKIRHRDFPVLDSFGKYCGMISRRSLLDMERKHIILVDHNEKTQAVNGLEDAEILEIIDHHRIGNLETMSPVFFRNQPLGCTATIVYQMYQENGVEIEPKIAGLLCSAILSDTLMYRSPTCTPVDKMAAEHLAKIAGIEVESYCEEMFRAGSALQSKTPEQIFYQDFKKFTANELSFGVGQINSMDKEELNAIKPKMISYIKQTCSENGLHLIFFMMTNIIAESTDLLFYGQDAKGIVETAFSQLVTDENSVLLENMVSRKKQLIPKLMAVMQSEK